MNKLRTAIVLHTAMACLAAAAGDPSAKGWSALDDAAKDKAQAWVSYLHEHQDFTPEDLHNAWATQKMEAGWTPGAELDEEKKTSPLLVPFEQLPQHERDKLWVAKGIVTAMANLPPDETAQAPAPATIEEARTKVATQAVQAALAAQGNIPIGYVPVQYIGRKPQFKDVLYGTGLLFTQDDPVKVVPDAAARQLLKHQDMFKRAEAVDAQDVKVDTQALQQQRQREEREEQAQTAVNQLRDTINSLPTKASIVEFAKNQFQQDLDPKAMKLEELRQAALSFVDLYGPKA